MKVLDRVDYHILDRLQKDGRITNAKLAADLNMSETPCWRRLKRLEEDGLVQSYRATLDRKKIGFGVLVFAQIRCVQHDIEATKRFEEIVRGSPNILDCHNTTGDDDYLLKVVARDLDDYSHFVETVLRTLPGISSISSNVSMREIKSSNELPLDDLMLS